MKKLILFIFLALPIYLIAQNSWTFDDYESRESDWEYILDVKQLDENKLVSISRSLTPLFHTLRIHDLKTGKELIKTKYNHTIEQTGFIHIRINNIKKEIYAFGMGTFIKDSIKQGFFIISKWDFNLNFIDEQIINLPDNKYVVSDYYVNKFDDEYICSFSIKKDSGHIEYRNIVIKVDLDGNFKELIIPKIKFSFDGLIKKIEGGGYWSLGDRTYIFDDSLNLEKRVEIENNAGGGISYKGFIFDDSTYLAGVPIHNDVKFGVRVVKYNKDFTIRKANIYYHTGRYNTLLFEGISYYDKNAIYLAAMDYWDLTYFDISKFDENLNLIWRKHIRLNENDTYYMFNIEALSDGSAVICGNKHLYNMEGKRDSSRAFMLKIAADGSIVSNKEVDKSGWDITVFPNPSQGDFKIEIGGNAQNAKLQIFDLQGKEVKVFDKLLSGTNYLNMYELSQGMYIWKLEKDNKIIGSGKWVKK